MNVTPTQIGPYSSTEMLVSWNTGEKYAVPYIELRYYCPCASCVDEHTGERTIQRTSISPDIRPTDVQLVGRYAVQIYWSDQHSTGMYHYDRLHELCRKQGRALAQ
ncbi:MAG: hypothetical protein A2X94_02590 [Bdellovibrionales bacterium GWB1_55_8]|nr:MAG: hypothetical protein A2X94_02590 [Bdellovibrionales bacterium GWB1_55_8]